MRGNIVTVNAHTTVAILASTLAATLSVAAAVPQWWEAPVLQAAVKTGFGAVADPHYMNKSPDDRYLVINGNSGNNLFNVSLYDLGKLLALQGETNCQPLATGRCSHDIFGGTIKGAAITSDPILGIVSSGSDTASSYGLFVQPLDGTWTPGKCAFKIGTQGGNFGADSFDFSPDRRHLYSNRYGHHSHLFIRWALPPPDGKSPVPGALFAECLFETPLILRARNISHYSIDGRELIYFGEGQCIATNSHPGTIAVADASTTPWTQYAPLLSDPVTFPHDTSGDITCIRVSGFGTGQLYLTALCNGGLLTVYKLSPDGLTLGEKVKTFTPEQTIALLGMDPKADPKLRNLVVTADGTRAVFAAKVHSGDSTDFELRVFSSKQ